MALSPRRSGSRARARRPFGLTRSSLFWPLCVLLGPSCAVSSARIVALVTPGLVARAAAAETRSPTPEEKEICDAERSDCETYCREQHGSAIAALEECYLGCQENHDRCLYEFSDPDGAEGCNADPDAAEAVACAVVATECAVTACDVADACDLGAAETEAIEASETTEEDVSRDTYEAPPDLPHE
ncbi:MAG: hypothetical protein R3A51_23940 [Nannocystaceae bacterium]